MYLLQSLFFDLNPCLTNPKWFFFPPLTNKQHDACARAGQAGLALASLGRSMVRDIDATVGSMRRAIAREEKEKEKTKKKSSLLEPPPPQKKKHLQDDLELLRCRSSGMELALVQGNDFTLVSVVLI